MNNPIRILFAHRIIDKNDSYYEFLKQLDYLSAQEFERKIKYLLKHYQFISMDDCAKYLRDAKRPKNCIVLTFDDGYKDVYTKVFPVLKKYKIPATVFLTTSCIGKSLLWHDKLLYSIIETKNKEFYMLEIANKRFSLKSVIDKMLFFNFSVERLKKFDNEQKKELEERVFDLLNVKEDFKNLDLMLDWNEIKEMHDSKLVSFGAHTVNHPILTKINLENISEEILNSKQIIEQKLGEQIKFFAYPNGNFNLQVENLAKKNAFICACTTYEWVDKKQEFSFTLGRVGFESKSFFMFGVRMAGLFNLNDYVKISSKNFSCWLGGYVLNRFNTVIRNKMIRKKPIHIFLAICDHFEPLWGCVDRQEGLSRVKKWLKEYPKIASKHRDSDGIIPKYTFFYPVEEYHPEYLELLADFCRNGFGEVEIHLHHDNDCEENLRETLINFKKTLASRHGLLSISRNDGDIKYGFIHGNWSLNNSRQDGRWCGVNNEIQILKETGCYADFTLPSVPSDTQTQRVNSIYYAPCDKNIPKSHNWGIEAQKNKRVSDALLLVQGPLRLNWQKRKFGIFPTIESGSLGFGESITSQRIKLWVESNIFVKGKPMWIFIKLHTHGCQEKNMKQLLENDLDYLFTYLEQNYNDGGNYILHYLSAREMVNIIKAVEENYLSNDFRALRDYKYVQQMRA